jgi:GNAT superfamily N-acetyltransferase
LSHTLTIRRAVLEDAPRLAELSEVLGYPMATEAVAQRLARLLGRAEDTVLVAELPSRLVVGWLHGSERELLESGLRCEILGLVVDARHRRLGAGHQLVDAVEAWAIGRGLPEIVVRSNVLRAESHPFYERLGYVRTKTQHAYRKRLAERDAV